MVFTALDVFSAGLPPLEDGRPGPASPLFDYIVRRLFASWNMPGGVLKYYRWMGLPDDRVARLTGGNEWPLIRAELDAGRPCPLGLVTVRSRHPWRLGLNHQVLAYGYSLNGGLVTIRVYDPNTDPDAADDVRIRLSPTGSTAIEHNVGIANSIRGLFRVGYRPVDPSRLEPFGSGS